MDSQVHESHVLFAQEGNLFIIKLLLVFGADANFLSSKELLTPLDVAVECNHAQAIDLLQQIGAVQGELAKKHCFDAKIPRLKSFHDTAKMKLLAQQRLKLLSARQHPVNGDGNLNGNGYHCNNGYKQNPTGLVSGADHNGDMESGAACNGEEGTERERLYSNQSLQGVTLKDMEDGHTLSTLYERLQQCINVTLDISGIIGCNSNYYGKKLNTLCCRFFQC